MLKTSLRGASCAFLLVAGLSAAHAADPVRIAGMLAGAAAATGDLQITYDKAIAKGDDITLSNVKVKVGADNTATLPNLVISGAVERPMGGFTAKRIAFDGGSAHAPEAETKWATGSVEDVVVPSAAEIQAHAKVRPFGKLTLGTLALSQTPTSTPVTATSVTVAVGPVSDTAPTTIHVDAAGVKMPIAFINNPIGNAMISRMGYTEFDSTVSVDSTYDTAKNAINVSALTIDTAKVGKIAFAAKLSDTSLGGIADPTQGAEARSAARLDSVSIRFDDAGFVGRMLDMQADLLGGTRDDVRDGLVHGALPLVLNYVENQAFRAQFVDAVGTFLANPKSFTITAMPAMPVPLGEALRMAVHEPLKLPDLLSPKVAANK